MRIAKEDATEVGAVWATATVEEAWQLLAGLVECFCPDTSAEVMELMAGSAYEPEPGWHAHVGTPDELTLEIVAASDAPSAAGTHTH